MFSSSRWSPALNAAAFARFGWAGPCLHPPLSPCSCSGSRLSFHNLLSDQDAASAASCFALQQARQRLSCDGWWQSLLPWLGTAVMPPRPQRLAPRHPPTSCFPRALFLSGFVSVSLSIAPSQHRGCGSCGGASAAIGAGREEARRPLPLCEGRAEGRGGGSRAFTAGASGPGARPPPGPGERRGLRWGGAGGAAWRGSSGEQGEGKRGGAARGRRARGH